jgi:hypothetical protein
VWIDLARAKSANLATEQAVTSHGFDFRLKSCFLNDYAAACDLILVNNSEDKSITFGEGANRQIEMYDNVGNRYAPESVLLANEGPGRVVTHFMVSKIPTAVRIVFLHFSEDASAIALLKIPCASQPMGSFAIEFRNNRLGGEPSTAINQQETNDEREIRLLLNRWTESLSRHDLHEHVDCYGPVLERYFKGVNVPRDVVFADKNRAFARFSSLHVGLVDTRIKSQSADRAVVEFKKTWDFRSTAGRPFIGAAKEQLVVTKASGGWMIVSETEIPQ